MSVTVEGRPPIHLVVREVICYFEDCTAIFIALFFSLYKSEGKKSACRWWCLVAGRRRRHKNWTATVLHLSRTLADAEDAHKIFSHPTPSSPVLGCLNLRWLGKILILHLC